MVYIYFLTPYYVFHHNKLDCTHEHFKKKIPFLCYRLSGMDFLILQQRLHMIRYKSSWQSATNLVLSECILFTMIFSLKLHLVFHEEKKMKIQCDELWFIPRFIHPFSPWIFPLWNMNRCKYLSICYGRTFVEWK